MQIKRLLLSAVPLAGIFIVPTLAQMPAPYLSGELIDVTAQVARDSLDGEAILVAVATLGTIDLGPGSVYEGFDIDNGTSSAWGYQYLTPSGDRGLAFLAFQIPQVGPFWYGVWGNADNLGPNPLDLSGAYSNSDAFAAQLRANATYQAYRAAYPDILPDGVELGWEPDSAALIPEEFPRDKPVWSIYYRWENGPPNDSTMACFTASGTGQTHCVRFGTSGVEEREGATETIRLTVAPNPVRDAGKATLLISSQHGEKVKEAGVYDIVGRKVLDLTEALVPDGTDAVRGTFDPADLPAGTYVCRVVQGSLIRSVRLIVE